MRKERWFAEYSYGRTPSLEPTGERMEWDENARDADAGLEVGKKEVGLPFPCISFWERLEEVGKRLIRVYQT